jgi:hypothetical protein
LWVIWYQMSPWIFPQVAGRHLHQQRFVKFHLPRCLAATATRNHFVTFNIWNFGTKYVRWFTPIGNVSRLFAPKYGCLKRGTPSNGPPQVTEAGHARFCHLLIFLLPCVAAGTPWFGCFWLIFCIWNIDHLNTRLGHWIYEHWNSQHPLFEKNGKV